MYVEGVDGVSGVSVRVERRWIIVCDIYPYHPYHPYTLHVLAYEAEASLDPTHLAVVSGAVPQPLLGDGIP